MTTDAIKVSIGPGRAVYPRLQTPDTKYDELGAYKSDISVPKAEAKENMDFLAKVYKDHVGSAPNKLDNTMWSAETDEEGEPTGNIVFKIRVKNKMTKKGELWDRKPKQFDAALRPCNVNPWGGSILAVNAEVYCWKNKDKAGVSLQPKAVQIINLVEAEKGQGASPEGFGFEKKDGFVADDDADGFTAAGQVDTSSDDDEAEDGDY